MRWEANVVTRPWFLLPRAACPQQRSTTPSANILKPLLSAYDPINHNRRGSRSCCCRFYYCCYGDDEQTPNMTRTGLDPDAQSPAAQKRTPKVSILNFYSLVVTSRPPRHGPGVKLPNFGPQLKRAAMPTRCPSLTPKWKPSSWQSSTRTGATARAPVKFGV